MIWRSLRCDHFLNELEERSHERVRELALGVQLLDEVLEQNFVHLRRFRVQRHDEAVDGFVG